MRTVINLILIAVILVVVLVYGIYLGQRYYKSLQWDTYQTDRACSFYRDPGSDYTLVICEDGSWWNAWPRRFNWGTDL